MDTAEDVVERLDDSTGIRVDVWFTYVVEDWMTVKGKDAATWRVISTFNASFGKYNLDQQSGPRCGSPEYTAYSFLYDSKPCTMNIPKWQTVQFRRWVVVFSVNVELVAVSRTWLLQIWCDKSIILHGVICGGMEGCDMTRNRRCLGMYEWFRGQWILGCVDERWSGDVYASRGCSHSCCFR